jgi:hypothetical protein
MQKCITALSDTYRAAFPRALPRRFYEGHSASGERAIGVALSRDGLTWTRPSGAAKASASAPLLSPSRAAGAWDAGGVGAPFAVPMAAGRWRLYYEGYGEGAARGWEGHGMTPPSGVGLALSADPSSDRDDVTLKPFRRRGDKSASA